MNYHESSEDYLESILMLQEKIGQVRSIDIVYKSGYTKASVSIAMKKLRESGAIVMDDSGYITLTEKGLQIARSTYNRHQTLSAFLTNLGVTPAIAEQDACKMEHILSDESFMRIREYNKKHF